MAKESKFTEDFEERLRQFSEECDHIQGFQFFLDSFNGFGGIATQCVDVLMEEFPKTNVFSILPFPYFENQVNKKFNLNHKTHFSNQFYSKCKIWNKILNFFSNSLELAIKIWYWCDRYD